jgi:TolB-like protein/DNA-binding winged helix-turn-helix (wHTH) protein
MDQVARAFPSLIRIDLAREADFTLGPLKIRPSRCEVEAEGTRHVLQRRVMQVLVALAHPTAEVVSHEELIRRCWGGLSVGEDAIGRCIGELRRFAAKWPEAPFEIETITGVGYRLNVAAGAASGVAATSPPPPLPFWRRGYVRAAGAGAALALAGLVAIWVGLGPWPKTATPPARVAVLPLETLSPGQNARYLADNIADEVLGVLSANQIEAVSRIDAAGLRGASRDRQAARLGVGLMVDGSVRDDGKETRVSVRLNDARTHVTLWSADYRRNTGTAADLGVEVAAKVADIVEIAEFARTNPPGLKDDAALSAVLETHDLLRRNSPESWARLLDLTQRVVAIAPDFAFGHSMLSTANAYAVLWNVMPQQSAAMEATARREAARTLAMDPHDAGAYFSLALLARTYREKDAILQKGLAAARHPGAPFGAVNSREAALLREVGRLRDALPYAQRALALDPLSPPKTDNLVWSYATLGEMAAAQELADQMRSRWPNHHNTRGGRLHMLAFYGAPADAIAVLNDPTQRPADVAPQTLAVWRTFVEAKQSGDPGLSARTARSIASAADAGHIDPGIAAMMLSSLGDVDLAFGQADKAGKPLKSQDDDPSFLFTPPAAAMRRDPRFMPLAARLGLVDYWRGTGKWPDFCMGPHAEIDCRAAAAKAGV